MKIASEKQVNLVNEFIESKLSEFSHIIKIEEKYIQFEYKDETFYLFPNLDGIPEICVLTDQIKSYPHFCLHKNLQYEEFNFYTICLYVSDEISFYNATYQEKFEFVINQFIRLMNLNKYELENEVNKEYRYHWNKNSESVVYSNVSPLESIDDVYMFEYRKKNDEKPKMKYILSKKFPFDTSIYSYTRMNCLYLDVIDMKGILPPPFKTWDSKLLKDLLFSIKRNRFTEEMCKILSHYKVKEKVLVFLRIPQFDNFEIGIKVTFSNDEKCKLKSKLNYIKFIDFIGVLNRNIDTSIIRNGGTPVECKKVLMIGCGSLGSYIARELPRIGINNITIVDGDSLEYGNLSRHILGEMFVGKNKAISMCNLLSIEYESMKFNAINKYVTDSNIDEIINNESDYDLVIITTGNEDLQYMLNKQLFNLKKFIPSIFCWLESHSVGSHTLVMKNEFGGCYNCLMNDNLNYITNSTKRIRYNGCGGVYSQYGTSILLNTSALVVDLISAWSSIKSNALYSYKTKNIMNSIEDIQFTEHYYEDEYGINIIESFKNKECDCCG